MQVVVIATVETQKEFQEKVIPGGIEVHFETTVASAKKNSDAYFYLLEEENLQKDLAALEAFQNPVFVNAVITTLNTLPAGFARINGWPGFIERTMVEVVAGEEHLEKVRPVLDALQWKFQFVPDVPGMISARVISMIVNEAYFALKDKVSTREEIDLAMKLGTNYPYGPFEWSEKIGLRKIYDLLSYLSVTDPGYSPAELLTMEIN